MRDLGVPLLVGVSPFVVDVDVVVTASVVLVAVFIAAAIVVVVAVVLVAAAATAVACWPGPSWMSAIVTYAPLLQLGSLWLDRDLRHHLPNVYLRLWLGKATKQSLEPGMSR